MLLWLNDDKQRVASCVIMIGSDILGFMKVVGRFFFVERIVIFDTEVLNFFFTFASFFFF